MTGASFAPFEIILPLAISFFTFTQIAYLVDVYRNRSLHYGILDYMLFVVFFPHLIAGPILRHWEIIPQFRKNVLHATVEDTAVGMALFTLGMIKKVLLADSVAPHANSVYGLAAAGTTLDLFSAWFGTVAFALQIYFDFSGYSDMAIGLARIFGIKFPLNFDSPYKATSIAEFWRRWHMTLSRFLREYIYFPLGGNRCGPARHSFNILVTMLISGLWHGASMGFVVWGGMHGLMLLVAFHWQKFTKNLTVNLERSQPYRLTAWLLTFVGVVLSWTFFRANSLSTATSVCASMLGIHGVKLVPEAGGLEFTEGLKWIAPLLCIVWFAPNSQELLRDYAPSLEAPNSTSPFKLALTPRVGLALGATLFLLAQSLFSSGPSPFIYFNF